VGTDRLDGQVHPLGHLGHPAAFDDLPEHLELPVAELVVRVFVDIAAQAHGQALGNLGRHVDAP